MTEDPEKLKKLKTIDTGKLAVGDVCELAKKRWQDARRWLMFWNVLLGVLGATLVVLILVLFWMLIAGKTVGGIVSGVAAVVDGVIVAWLVTRRTVAVEDEKAAWEEVKSQCKP